MNNNGIIFSVDALLALIVVITVLSGAVLLGSSGNENGPQQAQLYLKSSDASLVKYLKGTAEKDTSTSQMVNCSAISDFNSENQVSAKVRKCVGG